MSAKEPKRRKKDSSSSPSTSSGGEDTQMSAAGEMLAPMKVPPAIASEFTTDMGLVRMLIHTKAEQMLEGFPNNQLFIAHNNDRVTEVFKGLIRHNILAVPVLVRNGKYRGFIDMGDIVSDVVRHFGRLTLSKTEDFWKMIDNESQFRERRVIELAEFIGTRRNPFNPVRKGFSIWCILELIAKDFSVHRVPVVDENMRLFSIITESQLVRFLAKQELGSIKNMPVYRMSGLPTTVQTISEKDPAIQAFSKMIEHHIGGLAVLNDEGKVVNDISMRDLKGVAGDLRLFWRLYESTATFMNHVHAEYKQQRPTNVQTVNSLQTLDTVIKKIVENNIHRVYVVDDQGKPVSVVTLHDILRTIVDGV